MSRTNKSSIDRTCDICNAEILKSDIYTRYTEIFRPSKFNRDKDYINTIVCDDCVDYIEEEFELKKFNNNN